MTSPLVDYICKHTDAGTDTGIDVQFFNVMIKDSPTGGEFRQLISQHKGKFTSLNPFDGKEHSFIEVGQWIGDQATALRFMALGSHFKMWELLIPNMIIPNAPKNLKTQLAQAGYVTFKSMDGSENGT